MKSTGIKQVTKTVGQAVSQNSPTILTGLSVAGLVSTVVLAVKATPKALRLFKEELDYREESDDYPEFGSLTKKEIIQTTWKCYIPTVVMGGVTVACMVGANSINLRRNAALASVYSLSEAALKEYQAKVIETIGEKKEQTVRDEIAKDRVERDPKSNKEVIITGQGNVLCYDSISGRYFKSDIEKIRKLQNDLNHQLISEMWVSINDVYYELGLKATKIGDDIGWNVDTLIEFDFSTQLADDGTPCVVIDYSVGPRYDYRKLR